MPKDRLSLRLCIQIARHPLKLLNNGVFVPRRFSQKNEYAELVVLSEHDKGEIQSGEFLFNQAHN